MKKILLPLSLLCVNYFYAQEFVEPKTKRFNIEIGLFNNMPFKNSYEEVSGSMSNCFMDYKINKFQTIGFCSSFGYQFKLTKKLSIIPNINYQHLQLKTQRVGYTAGTLCDPVIAGLTISEDIRKYNLFGVSTAFNYNLRNINIENGAGVFCLSHNNDNYVIYNFYNRSDFYDSSSNYNSFILFPFSYHKLGFELIQNIMYLYVGANINYSKKLTQSIAPSISLKLKL